jgi:uncharacterized protein YjiS (DUF1127 family)
MIDQAYIESVQTRTMSGSARRRKAAAPITKTRVRLAELRRAVESLNSVARRALVLLDGALETHRRRRRQAYVPPHALLQIDDHLLRDIGLRRSDIHAAACGLPVKAFLSEDSPRGAVEF